jgi:DNA-directed RNA polymerase subunit RPC12/RpoP
MKKSDIDCSEETLAFRCLRCRNQVAEGVTIDSDEFLHCPGCGGDLQQMVKGEMFSESWGNTIPNPFYDPPKLSTYALSERIVCDASVPRYFMVLKSTTYDLSKRMAEEFKKKWSSLFSFKNRE